MKIRVHSNFFGFLKNNVGNSFLKSYKKNIKHIDFREELNMHKRWSFLFYVQCLLVFSTANSQTFPSPDSCNSKDLLLVNATMPSAKCETCTPGTTLTKPLTLYINNKTGSTRTSFAFWATLTVINSDGTIDLAHSGPISKCFSTIPKNATTPFIYGNISYACGQSLQLTNIWEAWTDASPNSTCPGLMADTSAISPKCGTVPVLNIIAGLDAIPSVTAASCSNTGGSITVSPQGGTGPYTVTLLGSPNIVRTGVTTSTTFNNLAAGNYTITLTDANNCPSPVTKTALVGSTGVSVAPTVTTPVFYCQNDTASVLTAVGTNLLWYASQTGGGGSTVAPTPSTTTAGNTSYWVSQTIAGKCESPRAEIVVTVKALPSAPTVSVVNNCDGSSDLTAENYTGSLLWSNTLTTTSIHVTNAATYTVTQTVNGCTSSPGSGASAPKTAPSAPTVSVINNCNGSSDLTAENYTGTLLWSNNATTATIHVTNAATYTVTQTVNGCISLAGSGISSPRTTPGAPTVSVINNCNGSSDLTASNFTGALLWSNNATTTSIHVTNAATYTVTQTVNGCTSLAGSGTSAPKTTPSAPTVSIVNNCNGSSDLTASNFTGALLWSNNATTTSIHVTNAATYTVTQTVNGCTSLAGSGTSAPKTTPGAPTVSVINNCNGSSDLTASNYTGTLLWSNTATTVSIHVTNAATYTVTQTVNGCTSLAGSGTSAPRTGSAAPTVSVVNNCNGSSDLTASNFTGALLWSNNATTTSIHVTDAATYTVTQTVNGCTSLPGSGDSAPKTKPDAPILLITQPSLCNAKGSIKICNPSVGYTYTLVGAPGPGTVASGNDVIFSDLGAGSNPNITATNLQGCTSLAADCNSGVSVCPTSGTGKTVNTGNTVGTRINSAIDDSVVSQRFKSSDFDVYPVPFKDQLTVKYNFNYTSNVKIEVFNLLGALILSKEDANGYFGKEYSLNLNLREITEQMYFVKVTTNRGSSSKKIISSR